VTRRKSFDPQSIPADFWTRPEVGAALCDRNMTDLFGLFFNVFPACTQVQLALLTGHDRADISNWVRGARAARVADIDVLERIAEGMAMPDAARVKLGLAPTSQPLSAFAGTFAPSSGGRAFGTEPSSPGIEVAVCGSRAPGTNSSLVDRLIPLLARLIVVQRWSVAHGPVGIGIEVMTHIADRYQPPGTLVVLGRIGHHRVIETCDYLIGLGGGTGTMVELDLAAVAGKKLLLIAAGGGAVAEYAAAAEPDPHVWLAPEQRETLTTGTEPAALIDTIRTAIRTDMEHTRD
jgi:hypothetical protein